MAQLGARLNGIEEVEGSSPSGSTKSDGKSNMLSARESGNGAEIWTIVHTEHIRQNSLTGPVRSR